MQRPMDETFVQLAERKRTFKLSGVLASLLRSEDSVQADSGAEVPLFWIRAV